VVGIDLEAFALLRAAGRLGHRRDKRARDAGAGRYVDRDEPDDARDLDGEVCHFIRVPNGATRISTRGSPRLEDLGSRGLRPAPEPLRLQELPTTRLSCSKATASARSSTTRSTPLGESCSRRFASTSPSPARFRRCVRRFGRSRRPARFTDELRTQLGIPLPGDRPFVARSSETAHSGRRGRAS